MSVEQPLMIDSTEAGVIERALENVPGRAIVNSINMENGRKRIDSVVPLAKKHGAALVALTIDEVGMAKTRERKDRKSTRLNSSHANISYAVFCLKKKQNISSSVK